MKLHTPGHSSLKILFVIIFTMFFPLRSPTYSMEEEYKDTSTLACFSSLSSDSEGSGDETTVNASKNPELPLRFPEEVWNRLVTYIPLEDTKKFIAKLHCSSKVFEKFWVIHGIYLSEKLKNTICNLTALESPQVVFVTMSQLMMLKNRTCESVVLVSAEDSLLNDMRGNIRECETKLVEIYQGIPETATTQKKYKELKEYCTDFIERQKDHPLLFDKEEEIEGGNVRRKELGLPSVSISNPEYLRILYNKLVRKYHPQILTTMFLTYNAAFAGGLWYIYTGCSFKAEGACRFVFPIHYNYSYYPGDFFDNVAIRKLNKNHVLEIEGYNRMKANQMGREVSYDDYMRVEMVGMLTQFLEYGGCYSENIINFPLFNYTTQTSNGQIIADLFHNSTSFPKSSIEFMLENWKEKVYYGLCSPVFPPLDRVCHLRSMSDFHSTCVIPSYLYDQSMSAASANLTCVAEQFRQTWTSDMWKYGSIGGVIDLAFFIMLIYSCS